jgi:zona occludens toxin
MTSDVRAIWRHWTFLGAGVCIVLFVVLFSKTGLPFSEKSVQPKEKKTPIEKPRSAAPVVHKAAAGSVSSASLSGARITELKVPPHPLSGYGIEVAGYVGNERLRMYQFSISQNGVHQYYETESGLRRAGYLVVPKNECIVELRYRSEVVTAVCHQPQVSGNPAAMVARTVSPEAAPRRIDLRSNR